jgi:hypothetical protein
MDPGKMRLDFLRLLYDMCGGNPDVRVNRFEIGDRLGISRDDTNGIVRYWLDGQEIKSQGLEGWIYITRLGLDSVERELLGLPPSAQLPFSVNVIKASVVDLQIQQGRGEGVQSVGVHRRKATPHLDAEDDQSSIVSEHGYPKEKRIFKKHGKIWLLVYDGVPKSVGDSVGMRYVCHLLQRPGQDIHASTMRTAVAGEESMPILGSAGEVLDAQALREYRDRIAEIELELAEAEANNDLARKESLNEEREFLYAEIGGATGLRGQNRDASSDRERARQAVSVAIHRAFRAIKKEHEPLWQHLHNSLNIGEFLSYQPDQSTFWTT